MKAIGGCAVLVLLFVVCMGIFSSKDKGPATQPQAVAPGQPKIDLPQAIPAPAKNEPDIADLWQRHGRNFFSVDGDVLPVSQVQTFYGPGTYRVIQIVNRHNVIAMMRLAGPEETVWLGEMNTNGLVDGKTYQGEGLAVIGTKRYTSVLGGAKTVTYAVPRSVVDQGINQTQFRSVISQGLSLGTDHVKAEEDRQKEKERQRVEQELAAEMSRVNKIKAAEQARLAAAARKLVLAKSQLEAGQIQKNAEGKRTVGFAVERLQAIVRDFPGTPAAIEAQEILDKLKH